jgi:hypothetical protein
MLPLSLDQAAALRSWFMPERPGPLVGLHVLNTGHGTLYADRWPEPRAILAESARNYALAGEPGVLAPADLDARFVLGMIDAPARFEALVQAAFPAMTPWPRVILDLSTSPVRVAPRMGVTIRRLGPADASAIAGLDPELAWIASTWGGAAGLAASGYAWGAFADGQLVAVACSFFVGDRYEDIGVVTHAAHRGLALSAACAVELCDDIQRRGHQPTWTTATDHRASLRVAEKLGFGVHHHDRLLLVGGPPPPPS